MDGLIKRNDSIGEGIVTEQNIQRIEVAGHVYEVDMSTARKVEAYRVGDAIKILIKEKYGSSYNAFPGAIVGIDAFKKLPTIIVAYIKSGMGTPDGSVHFAYLNDKNEDDIEICPMVEDDLMPSKDVVLEYFNKALGDLEDKRREIEMKRDYFVNHFGTAFGAFVKAAEISEILDGKKQETAA